MAEKEVQDITEVERKAERELEDKDLRYDLSRFRDNQGWSWPIIRPVPFSHRKKKSQQKEKQQRRKEKDDRLNNDHDLPSRDDLLLAQLESLNNKNNNNNKNTNNHDDEKKNAKNDSKLETVFERESQEEIEMRKKKGFEPLDLQHRDHVWREEFESEIIDMPVRPPYVKGESVEQLEERERSEFNRWMRNVILTYGSRLNYFEMNLEVWRQLWRVIERSDILLLLVDARFPLFHFSPSLYNYVVKELKKPMILILNKTDVVEKRIVDEWEKYFISHYPSLKIVRFSSFPSPDGEMEVERKRKMEKGRKQKYENGEGKRALLEAIQSFGIKKEATDAEGKHRDDSILTIGAVGHPNVGKSSLINGLAGKKVVSTSSTPGHTKHFQTIYINLNNDNITDNNNNNDTNKNNSQIKLCDCPGLVFPAVDISKELQILSGVYPISQVREVFSAIRYLAERVPLETIYNLPPPANGSPWSPYLLLEAYAIKRGYREAKAGQADNHRAGGEILRDCLNGHIVISWPPPGVHLPSSISSFCPSSSSEEETEQMENDENEANDENRVNNFRENQRKKRERKMKKKQQILEISTSGTSAL